MGYGFYFVEDRPAGYNVLATCDKRGCDNEIDRGLGYLCGTDPHSRWGGDNGCGMYFCGDHLGFVGERGGCSHRKQKEPHGKTLSCMASRIAPDGIKDYCLDRMGHSETHGWETGPDLRLPQWRVA